MSDIPFELAHLRPTDLFNSRFRPDLRARKKSHFQITFLFAGSPERQQAMHDLYTYCRLVDDIADEEGLAIETRRALLDEVRDWIKYRGLKNNQPIRHQFWNRFQQEIHNFHISWETLEGILDGVAMDLEPQFKYFQTWNDLDRYIYGVASCVGEAVLSVLGIGGPQGKTYAHHMGRALQLWNILRDLEDDFQLGRIYIPQEFLRDRPLPDQLERTRKELFERGLSEWLKAEPYSLKCIPAEMMGQIYYDGARNYWQYGSKHRLTKIEKLKSILTSVIFFGSSRRI